MKSTQGQFWRIIEVCMERYSKSTQQKVVDLMISHENIIKIDKMLESNPTEQELIKLLDKNFPRV